MPERLKGCTPWRFAWHEPGTPSLAGLSVVDVRLSPLDESTTQATFDDRSRKDAAIVIRLEHDQGMTRAWVCSRTNLFRLLLAWTVVLYVVMSVLIPLLDLFGPAPPQKPLDRLRAEVARRAGHSVSSRTGAGTP